MKLHFFQRHIRVHGGAKIHEVEYVSCAVLFGGVPARSVRLGRPSADYANAHEWVLIAKLVTISHKAPARFEAFIRPISSAC
jgi:hypothetical protein